MLIIMLLRVIYRLIIIRIYVGFYFNCPVTELIIIIKNLLGNKTPKDLQKVFFCNLVCESQL